jgi:hypothetical protein
MIDGSDGLEVIGPGIRYIKCCQSIFREVNINALRKERNQGRFILRPTGVRGVFVLIHPGAKLRTGENLSIIWFKIILLREFIKPGYLSSSWVFKKLHFDTKVYHSSWLSTDANRLDHYLRCYDKILMSYACYCSFSERPLSDEMRLSVSDTLGIIIMIYMEDKRSTSKMLQDARYLVMTCLSMYSYYEDVLDKFKEPIRTPLQSYLLNKMINFAQNPETRLMLASCKFGNVNVEAGTGDAFDRLAGSDIRLPRMLTNGSEITFPQILCEMYFSMLFNKNQDDPTHASFQILKKILEGEKSLHDVKNMSKLHLGFKNNAFTDALELIHKPHKNQFSRTAIIIGSKLQSISKSNKSSGGVAHTIACNSPYTNKYLDEFATFKSSSTIQNLKYNPKVYSREVRGPRLEEEKNEDSKNHISGVHGVQNRRRRCIEGVQELLERNYMRSFDLIKNHLTEPIYFQIFKKNQVGGVREILILDIYKRVLINILESVSRSICNEDDREMLTHGDKKLGVVRDMLRSLKRAHKKTLIMNYNMDKTKWAQSFQPIQFLYMFLPFKHKYPSMFRFIVISLIMHSNKKLILPEKLVRAWKKDVTNRYRHWMDDNLQKLKENFLLTNDLSYENESNMGQGILHFTSSFYHLCVISLRDEVYKRLCQKYNLDSGSWYDLVSSDDSYTAHALPMDTKHKVKLRISLFLKAQEVVERVMNVWTSCSKTSISLLINEFNSVFGSNLTTFPTTLKFAISSVHPVNTDSFFRMVKEGYIASRQIIENGGSLELYSLSNLLNKRYAESIYHTYDGGINSPRNFGLRPEYTPYQLGIYPVLDPGLMIMFGPESHNYLILHNEKNMTDIEARMFRVMHSLVDIKDPELLASFSNVDNVFVGVNRIETVMGPINKLENIKRSIPMDRNCIMDKIIENPLLLFSPPKDIEDLKVKVFIKLHQNSAAEALRTTAASIYYGRVSATVTANAFTIPNRLYSEDDEGKFLKDGKESGENTQFKNKRMTYSECIKELLSIEPEPIQMNLFYPHQEEFESVLKLSYIDFDYKTRDIMETQNIRNLQLTKLHQRIKNPIIKLLTAYWVNPESHEEDTSYARDWINIQESIPIIKDSMEETLDYFKGDRKKQVQSLLLVILRLMGFSSKPMKAIVYGPSSRAFDHSYLILKQSNNTRYYTSNESRGLFMASSISKDSDKICFAFNIFALSLMFGYSMDNKRYVGPMNTSNYFSDDEIDNFFLDNSMSIASQKKIMMMLLYQGRILDFGKWSHKTKTKFHQWIVRSKKIGNRYEGNYELIIQLGKTILKVNYNDVVKKINLIINDLNNPKIVKELIDEAIQLSSFTDEVFWSMVDRGFYLYTSEGISPITKPLGFKMEIKHLTEVVFRPGPIKHRGGFFELYDSKNELFIRTVEGLLHTDYNPGNVSWDIDINDLSLRSLLYLRPFNVHFNIEHCSDDDLCRILENSENPLKVPKPLVTDVTNFRLGTNFKVRSTDSDFAELTTEEYDQEHEIKAQSDVNLFQFATSMTEEDFENLKNITDEPINDLTNFLLDCCDNLNLLTNMIRQRIKYQPKKIFERVINFKYQIIAKMVTTLNMLNRRTINLAKKTFNEKGIIYSLVYVYDRQFSTKDAPSPNGCEIRINPKFSKFIDMDDFDSKIDE